MTEKSRRHVEKATIIYGKITVCSKCRTWDNSFHNGSFWFNTEDNSTHTIKEECNDTIEQRTDSIQRIVN